MSLFEFSENTSITTGSHVPDNPATKDQQWRIVVWATHPSIAAAVTTLSLYNGRTVVERTRLQEVFNEQKIRLKDTSAYDAQVLRVEKLLSANLVIFAEWRQRATKRNNEARGEMPHERPPPVSIRMAEHHVSVNEIGHKGVLPTQLTDQSIFIFLI